MFAYGCAAQPMDARAAAACSGAKVTSFEHAHTTVTWRLLITCYMTSTSGRVKMTIAAVLSWIAIKNYSIRVYTCTTFPPEIVLTTEYSASQRGSSTASLSALLGISIVAV